MFLSVLINNIEKVVQINKFKQRIKQKEEKIFNNMAGQIVFKTGTRDENENDIMIIQSPNTLYWNDDMRIFIDRREWKRYPTGTRLSDMSDSSATTNNGWSSNAKRSRSSNPMLN